MNLKMPSRRSIILILLIVVITHSVQNIIFRKPKNDSFEKMVQDPAFQNKMLINTKKKFFGTMQEYFNTFRPLSIQEQTQLFRIMDSCYSTFDLTKFAYHSQKTIAELLHLRESEFFKMTHEQIRQCDTVLDSEKFFDLIYPHLKKEIHTQIEIQALFYAWWNTQHPEYHNILPTHIPTNEVEYSAFFAQECHAIIIVQLTENAIEITFKEGNLPQKTLHAFRSELSALYTRYFTLEQFHKMVSLVLEFTHVPIEKIVFHGDSKVEDIMSEEITLLSESIDGNERFRIEQEKLLMRYLDQLPNSDNEVDSMRIAP